MKKKKNFIWRIIDSARGFAASAASPRATELPKAALLEDPFGEWSKNCRDPKGLPLMLRRLGCEDGKNSRKMGKIIVRNTHKNRLFEKKSQEVVRSEAEDGLRTA